VSVSSVSDFLCRYTSVGSSWVRVSVSQSVSFALPTLLSSEQFMATISESTHRTQLQARAAGVEHCCCLSCTLPPFLQEHMTHNYR